MNSKALLTLLALLGWFLFCQWWWCSNKERCDCDASASEVAASAGANSNGVITFNVNQVGPQIGSGWPALRDSITALIKAGKRLEIVGQYGSKEQYSGTFENLGVARADSIKQLFLSNDASLNAGRITCKGQLNADLDNAANNFVASDLRVLDTIATPKAEGGIVATDSNDILIYFPTGSAQKNVSAEVDAYLKTLAKRLSTSGEKALVIGHTDNKGKRESNLALSKSRAEQIKRILVNDGVPEAVLTTEGKADSEPVGDNNTEAGRAQNRRVEIKISK